MREVSPGTVEQVGGYLGVLINRYGMIERRQPIFAKPNSRRGRYYIRDNFLRSWLAALHGPVSAIAFRPENVLIRQADVRLEQAEGHGLERLVGALHEERSRRGLGDFSLSRRIEGYWDRKNTEIDLVAIDDERDVIRFATCKRSAEKLLTDVAVQEGHARRFLESHKRYQGWTVERVSVAPRIPRHVRRQLERRGIIARDLIDLTEGL